MLLRLCHTDNLAASPTLILIVHCLKIVNKEALNMFIPPAQDSVAKGNN